MADSILCSINMAGGAINIYYDTILAQNKLNSNTHESASVSIPSGWKTVIIMTGKSISDNDKYILAQPCPIFIESSYFIQMPALYSHSGSAYVQSIWSFARITSNTLYVNGYTGVSYIVAA